MIGVISAADIGIHHAENPNTRINGVYVAALMDADIGRLKRVAAECGAEVFDDGEEQIQDTSVDAAAAASQDTTHEDLVLECIRTGNPVAREKPLTAKMDETKQVVDAEVAHGRKLSQVDFMRRIPRRCGQELVQPHPTRAGRLGEPLPRRMGDRARAVDRRSEKRRGSHRFQRVGQLHLASGLLRVCEVPEYRLARTMRVSWSDPSCIDRRSLREVSR